MMRNVGELERIINQPDVKEGLAPGYGRIDFSEFYNNKGNFFLRRNNGALIFASNGKGEFEVHVAFPPEMRGAFAVKMAKDMVQEAFTRKNVRAIYGLTPIGDLPARMFARACGFHPVGKRYDRGGMLCVEYYADRSTWDEF